MVGTIIVVVEGWARPSQLLKNTCCAICVILISIGWILTPNGDASHFVVGTYHWNQLEIVRLLLLLDSGKHLGVRKLRLQI